MPCAGPPGAGRQTTPTLTSDSQQSDSPIRGHDDLLALFHEAAASEGERLGPEMEKIGVRGEECAPVAYEVEIARVLGALETRFGWKPEREKAGGPLIALRRGDASVTLEPGGQLELSGRPSHDVHAIRAEMEEHLREIAPESQAMGVRWLGVGFHPFARREDLHWVPKGRYAIMREYLPTRGTYGLDMMLRTATVQVNLDYHGEADAMRKLRACLAIAPLCAAMFANSPWVEGKRHEGLSMRARVWLDVDAPRTGLVPGVWKEDAGFADYVEWALDAPMFLLKRGDRILANTGQTFRDFLASGFQGERATQADWQQHLNTLFPEVRLKRTLEIRSADMQGMATACALPALYAGLLYDARALAELEQLVAPWTFEEVSALQQVAWKAALRAPFRGEPLAAVAERVVDIAMGGLERRDRKDAGGQDERVHLRALAALVARGECPADALATIDTSDPAAFRREVCARTVLALPA